MSRFARTRLLPPAAIGVLALVAAGCSIGVNSSVTKTVRGAPSGDAEFTIEATCHYEDSSDTYTRTFDAKGGTDTSTFGAFPGAHCTITETDDGDARLYQIVRCDIEPSDIESEPAPVAADVDSDCDIAADGLSAELTIGDDGTPGDDCPYTDEPGGGAEPEVEPIGCEWLDVTIEVVNYFPNAKLTVAKVIEDPALQGFDNGFDAHVECTQGDRTELDTTVELGRDHRTESFDVTVLPDADQENLVCTVTETDTQGATSTSYNCDTSGSEAACNGNQTVEFDYSQFAADDFEPSPVPAGTVAIINTWATPTPPPTPTAAPAAADVVPAAAVADQPRFTG